jgi:periplasmic protein TonB
MNAMRLPVVLSTLGHVVVLALLLVFASGTRPTPEPLEKRGIEIMFSPSLAQPLAPLTVEAPIQPAVPPEESTPPLPAPEAPPAPVAEVPVAPPDQTVTAEAPPPPPRKPVVRQRPKYVARQPEPARPSPNPPAPFAASQYAAAPAAAASLPGPDPTVSYRALVSAWFESHKRYPDSARERGEEGSVALRFRVDRFGRVVDYALLTSTGYADLDQGVDQMMRGAQLPPFPAGMTQPQIEVAVRIGFSLTR